MEDARADEPRRPRVETAVVPVIQAESVQIPTPAWGALSRADTEVLEAELVESGQIPQATWPEEAEQSRARRATWPGWVSLLLAVATAVVHGIAVGLDAAKQYEAATALAWTAIGCSAAAVAIGIIAVALARGRGPGVAGIVLGLAANPWIVLQVLAGLRG